MAAGTETAIAVTGTVTEIVTVIGTATAIGTVTVDAEDGAGVTTMITLIM